MEVTRIEDKEKQGPGIKDLDHLPLEILQGLHCGEWTEGKAEIS